MSDRWDRVRERWQRSWTVLRAPRVVLEASGDADAHALYRSYTARHPRFRIVAAKRWGVALLRVPDTLDEYLAGRRMVRRRRRHAETRGFRYAQVSPLAHLDDLLEVNRSAPVRQGHEMASHYTDRTQLAERLAPYPAIHAVVDGSGRVRAYAVVPDLGDVVTFRMLIGHADFLNDGVMFLLMTEVIRTAVDARQATGSPTWLMYDTFWGASRGLATFKENCGFRPYTVDWRWVERA